MDDSHRNVCGGRYVLHMYNKIKPALFRSQKNKKQRPGEGVATHAPPPPGSTLKQPDEIRTRPQQLDLIKKKKRGGGLK